MVAEGRRHFKPIREFRTAPRSRFRSGASTPPPNAGNAGPSGCAGRACILSGASRLLLPLPFFEGETVFLPVRLGLLCNPLEVVTDERLYSAKGRAHVIERFQRKDFGHMDIQVTIDDPKAYTRPWPSRSPQSCRHRRTDGVHLQREQPRSRAFAGQTMIDESGLPRTRNCHRLYVLKSP